MFLLFIPFYIINSVFISKNQISKQKKENVISVANNQATLSYLYLQIYP